MTLSGFREKTPLTEEKRQKGIKEKISKGSVETVDWPHGAGEREG